MTVVMPVILVVFAIVMALLNKKLFDSYLVGAKEGLNCCINLLPTLLLVMVGVGALFSSGAVDVLCSIFSPLLSKIGIADEMLPTIILRPFSGSGVTALADRLFKKNGADSVVSKTACLLMGSTDTIIYTLAMYFSAAEIKKTRHAVASSFAVFVFSIIVCNLAANLLFV